ncbi:hypothetical protein [Bacillus benzoevorans]|uniref:Uncharacterized protein n=1 Tax=Bacillus benzoevorans TaxID=1456 RepID=A0A7X0HV51_9BACI|nr:hypothetical protein [Bacillus benzoevorans]MBB6447378.1 hypothetical protein [Bacillus benzoevorans]
MIRVNAFLLEEATVELSHDGVERIMKYLFNDWVRMGFPGTLELPTVQAGTFRGYVNDNGAPVGQFKTDEGAIYKVLEDSAELIA